MGRCGSCCGRFFRSLLFSLLVGGIACSILTIRSCDFVDYSSNQGEDEGTLVTGLFMHYNETGSCVFYPETREYDDQEFYARIASSLAPVAATISFCLLFLECCCCNCCLFNYLIHPFIPLGLIIAQVCQGLSFLFFGSGTFCGGDLMNIVLNKSESCTFATGSLYSLVAFISYFICGVFVLCVQRPDPICCCKNKVADSFIGDTKDDSSTVGKKKATYKPLSVEEGGDPSESNLNNNGGMVAGGVPPNMMMMAQQFPNMQQMQQMQQIMMQRAANPAAQMNQQYPMQMAQYANHPAMMQQQQNGQQQAMMQQQQNGQQQYRFVAVPFNQSGQNGQAGYTDQGEDDDDDSYLSNDHDNATDDED